MISKHEISNVGDAARYHDRAFAKDGISSPRDGRDNYYVGEQANAVWQGEGAKLLGIDGQAVTRDDFIAFLEGKMPHPKSGAVQDLAENARGADRRAGVDFTISPPKSVSVVGLIGGDDRVLQAHRAANASTMQWLERHGSVVRVRHDSEVTPHMKGNLLYATVVHETNRANEPQIHSHNVIVAAVFDKDSDKWRSLTNDQLYQIRTAGDTIYKTELARRLKDIGYELTYTKNNVDFEISGVREEHLKEFSSRSSQIDAALKARGIDPETAGYHARQAAALDSRAAKVELPREVLSNIWQEAARDVGMDLGPLVGAARARAAERAPDQDLGVPGRGADPGTLSQQEQKAALRAVSWAVEHLSERQQAFRGTELVTSALEFEPGLTLDHVEWAVRKHASGKRLVNGTIENYPDRAWTTQAAIRAESQLVSLITEGKGAGNVVLDNATDFHLAAEAFEKRMTENAGVTWQLSAEQRAAAHNVLLHPDTYQGIQGEAGTGKTAALAFVRDVAESRGWHVIGMATSSDAARELEESSGIKSHTVARFFADRNSAIKEGEREVEQLRRAISQHGLAAASGQRPSYERARLRATSLDQDFGVQRYAFDHQKAAVYRATNSISSLLGNFFTDLAVRGEAQQALAAGPGPRPSLAERLKSDMLGHAVRASDAIGRALTSYEKVGDVEANAARNALYLDGKHEHALKRELDLKEAALENLRRTGNTEGRKTLLVMDESSLTGALDATRVAELAKSIGARVVFQGDVQQHGSVPAGRIFWQAQRAGMNTAILQETRRFDNATEQVKEALSEFKLKRFEKALRSLDRHEVADASLAKAAANLYAEKLQGLEASGVPAPKVGVVTNTNADRKRINAATHDELLARGRIGKLEFVKLHLDDPKLTAAQRTNVGMMAEAKVDRLVFRKNYQEVGVVRGDILRVSSFDVAANRLHVIRPDGKRLTLNPQKQDLFDALRAESRVYSVGDRVTARAIIRLADEHKTEVTNGAQGRIAALDELGATVTWSDGRSTRLDNHALTRVDHAYARTSFKEQGATNNVELLVLSQTGAKAFNVESHYVSITRGKLDTVLVTSDFKTLLRNAGAEVEHTMALTEHQLTQMQRAVQESIAKTQRQLPAAALNQVPTPHQAQHQLVQHQNLPSTTGPLHRFAWADRTGAQTLETLRAHREPSLDPTGDYTVHAVAPDPAVTPPDPARRVLIQAYDGDWEIPQPALNDRQLRAPAEEIDLDKDGDSRPDKKAAKREAAQSNSPTSLSPSDLLAQPDPADKSRREEPEHQQARVQPDADPKRKDTGWEMGF